MSSVSEQSGCAQTDIQVQPKSRHGVLPTPAMVAVRFLRVRSLPPLRPMPFSTKARLWPAPSTVTSLLTSRPLVVASASSVTVWPSVAAAKASSNVAYSASPTLATPPSASAAEGACTNVRTSAVRSTPNQPASLLDLLLICINPFTNLPLRA